MKLACVCASMKPGSIILPPSLTTFVDGPTKALAPSLEPTYTILPSLTATAWATPAPGFTV